MRAACRQMGVHHSTFYAWKRRFDRYGLEALRVRERRRPRTPNQIGPHLEQRIIAVALGHPGYGPRRISGELAREKWAASASLEHGILAVLCRVGLNTRSKGLALIARHADPYERKPDRAPAERHVDASHPGEKVQLDCFYVGRLSGTKGTVSQCSAIDVASAYAWAELDTSERNPRSQECQRLLHRVAAELKAAGWKLGEVTTDNGSEFRANSSERSCRSSEHTSASSRPDVPTQTAASSACSSRSSRSAGAPPSHARWSKRGRLQSAALPSATACKAAQACVLIGGLPGDRARDGDADRHHLLAVSCC